MPNPSTSVVSFASTDVKEHTENLDPGFQQLPRLSRQNTRTSQYDDLGTVDENTSLLGRRTLSSRISIDADLISSSNRRKRKPRSYSQASSWRSYSPILTRRPGLRTPKTPRQHGLADSLTLPRDDIVWYDQFTSTDWVRDSIADGHRVLELRKKKGLRGRLQLIYDAAQGWILITIIGALVAASAYFVDILEAPLYDWKRGYCQTQWYHNRATCCAGARACTSWKSWSTFIPAVHTRTWLTDWCGFILGCLVCAIASCYLTLQTKTVVPSHIATTFDENLGAERHKLHTKSNMHSSSSGSPSGTPDLCVESMSTKIHYPAAGSGVAEVKVILSGFVLHGYLGAQTFVLKSTALVLAVASGMSLGKEGPFVHVATCIGNIACRLFSKYNLNDAKRREILSASAASGVAVAFGSPLGGVLFSLEEVSYYFPPKTLFRTFSCCIVAALSLKFWNPYGTNKIVIFEVRYTNDWQWFELVCFAFVGMVGGLMGALFIKISRFWATTFRRIPIIKHNPMLEVSLVALVTGLISYWNRFTNLAVTELLLELASPCSEHDRTGLCPVSHDGIPAIIRYLLLAFVVKAFLTVITFGIKVPAGIYVPSMVVGGLLGRIVGHSIQYIALRLHDSWYFGHCPSTGNLESCVTPGVYALVAAGATMCGVTRLSVTLVVILFELTGSLDHVVPFSLGILFAKWTADCVEPRSIYDSLIDMNSYPYMDTRSTPVFDSELGDITPRSRSHRIIDITISPLVKASELRSKLIVLQNAGELDGGLPIVRDKLLVGLIPAPDLEFALDRLTDAEDLVLCQMSDLKHGPAHHRCLWMGLGDDALLNGSDSELDASIEADDLRFHRADLTSYVDPAPVALDVHSPMDLVYQCFVKLGLRFICVVEAGEFKGMVHKKVFVKYVKDNDLDLHHH